LSQREQEPPQRDVIGNRRMADGTEEDGVVRSYDLERVARPHPAVLVVVPGPPRQLAPLEREAERVDRLARLRHDLRPGAVAGDYGDAMRHAHRTLTVTSSYGR